QAPDWRQQIREGWRTPLALLQHLQIQPDRVDCAVDTPFPMRVPRAFSNRMQIANPADPLLRQVLPLKAENDHVAGFCNDPVGDIDSRPARGLLHKYHGRALLITTGACAIHCRYCFRREFPYAAEHASPAHWQAAIDYIADHSDISEVILSGGDPWMLGNERLHELTETLKPIQHIQRLRIHTRMPITLPDRVNPGLLAWLGSLPWQKIVVVHANHANEFDSDVAAALKRLKNVDVTVFNQAVLLDGVNNEVDALCDLMQTGFAAGAIPYYLHLLDRVHGSAHFEVNQRQALELMLALRKRLSGYLVPRLVREQAGAAYKLPVF
ncbi:MAG: EF-P beta-lysylation protein EpmB, partial [Pseudomonadota bacterium]